jgi:hypothetical protein
LGPVAIVVANDDQGIEEAIERFDDGHQPFDVCVRRIALIWRRFHLVDRQ